MYVIITSCKRCRHRGILPASIVDDDDDDEISHFTRIPSALPHFTNNPFNLLLSPLTQL